MSALRNDEAPAVAAAKGFREQTSADIAILTDLQTERKALATLQAQLALRGFALNELSTGSYLISRWDLTLHVSDLAGVRQFYAKIGGRP